MDPIARYPDNLKVKPAFRTSLQLRLLIVFMLVGLLPMFFAAELASQVVTHAFENNLKTWLLETSNYIFDSIVDSNEEAKGVLSFITHQPEIMDNMIEKRSALPVQISQLMQSQGYDLFAISDDQGNTIYSNIQAQNYERIGIKNGIDLYQVRIMGSVELLISTTENYQYKGREYRVMLGSWFDDEFFSHLSEFNSLNFRLYTKSDNTFKEIYRSQGTSSKPDILSPSIVAALNGHDHQYFDRHADNDVYTGLYLPLKNDVGQTQGAVFCGLRTNNMRSSWISRTNIFLVIFLTGTALSLVVSSIFSHRLARPLRKLATSVHAITEGDYRQRVEVVGDDEIAELARAYNEMAQRLEQLHNLEAQLRHHDRLSVLGKAAAGIAHEVRNPLGIIRTSAELIRRRQKMSEADGVLLENVISEVSRIDRIITEFLSFVKPSSLILSPVGAIDIINRVIQFCEPEYARLKIEINLQNDAPQAIIDGNVDELYQATLNIFINALDAMENGGVFTIRLFVEKQFLHIKFTDTGPGIADSVQAHLFDPFVTTKAKGIGLGLAKVLNVMEGHHGSVTFKSEAGVGAMFEFILPLSKTTYS